MPNTKLGLESSLKRVGELANTGLNERTRLKIVLTQILTEQGHDLVQIADAINDVCNCDFRALRAMFGMEPGPSNAKPDYKGSYDEYYES